MMLGSTIIMGCCVFVNDVMMMSSPPTQYWQVSSVVLKALGTACTQSNKDSSRIVSGWGGWVWFVADGNRDYYC